MLRVGEGPGYARKRRRALAAALLSAAVPGIGQIFVGRSIKGLGLVSAAAFALVLSIWAHGVLAVSGHQALSWAGDGARTVLAFLPYITVWSFSVADAAAAAGREAPR